MILVDSSVWVDYLRDLDTPQTVELDSLLGRETLAVGDLILTEVLQGCTTDRAFETALAILSSLDVVAIGGAEVAIEAARNFRRLRARGITIRKTIDTLIATRCIRDDHRLLFSDRDFDPFVTHLGLRSAMA
ncbi:MAG: PIN domain nuclease [Allosphingosinicella sp.]